MSEGILQNIESGKKGNRKMEMEQKMIDYEEEKR